MKESQKAKHSPTKFIPISVAFGLAIVMVIDFLYTQNGIGIALGTGFGAASGIVMRASKSDEN